MIAYLFLTLISFEVFSTTRQKIVVIDTGVSFRQSLLPYMCENGLYSTGLDWRDSHGHGSNVIGLIAKKIDIKKTCIVSIRLEINENPELDIIRAMSIAEKLKPVGINISMAGDARYNSELLYIIKMLSSGIKIVVAAGNENINLDKVGCIIYPACYLHDMKKIKNIPNIKNFIVVGANDTGSSNTGTIVTVIEKGKDQGYPKMSGTSQATANFTGKIFSK